MSEWIPKKGEKYILQYGGENSRAKIRASGNGMVVWVDRIWIIYWGTEIMESYEKFNARKPIRIYP